MSHSKPVRKTLTMLMSVTLAGSLLLAGCSSGNSNGEAAGPGNNGSAKPDVVTENPAAFKFDPPVTVHAATRYQQQSETDFKPGESVEDNQHLRWMKEKLGIDVKFDFIVPTLEDYTTKMRLLLSGGSPLPDTFIATVDLATDMINAGKAMPLNELMDKYNSPQLKELYENYPEVLYPVTREGKIYGIPNMFAMDEGSVMWIREDWLQAAGKEAPKTIDELGEVLKAFTENDPDQNGKNDTFGMAVSLKDSPFSWMSSADPIAGAYSDYMPSLTSITEYWVEDENGELAYSAIRPEQKDFLAKLADWNKNGYIDPEAGIKDPAKAAEMAASGKAGVIFGPYWMDGYPLKEVKGFKAYPLPSGPDGQVGRAEKPLVHDYTMISKDFDHPEAVLGYINKLFSLNFGESDPYFSDDFKNGYHEGYDYVVHDGKVVRNNYDAAGVPQDKWPNPNDPTVSYGPFFPFNEAPLVPYLGDGAFQKFEENPDAEPANLMEASTKALTERQLSAGLVRVSQNDSAILNKFNGAPTATMQSKGELLLKLARESYLKIIMGAEPVDYFDTFVEQWKKNGGDQVTKEVNDWYKSVQ
ncbi:extracellular solute-binding protein [Paenibacillus macerans]|uniref:extracellular solute-binding protein n=1 Tax=Paenibacillus macerans TaxID=44252 RepID=UPI003D314CC0